MGLRQTLARAAAGHAHVLPVEVPGHWRARAALERDVLRRGWSLALSPADADVLVVCGVPGPQLSQAIDRVWHQMPGPRVRVDVDDAGQSSVRLDGAHAALLDTAAHQDDAGSRPSGPALLEDDADQGDMDHGDQGEHGEHGEMDHGEMDHGDQGEHGEHGEMDHGDMEMSPGGIPLAGGGEDRDDLEMDVLNVRFGPVMRHWPAGLSLRCTLQGDVVSEAQAELVDSAAPAAERAADRGAEPARHLDGIAAFLAVAGWDDSAAEARSIRDTLLRGGSDQTHQLRRLHQRVRRSVALRWALRGVRPVSDEEIEQQGLPDSLAGDTFDRLLRMFDQAGAETSEEPESGRPGTLSTDQLARLVTGLDVATARLVVASIGATQLRDAEEREAQHA